MKDTKQFSLKIAYIGGASRAWAKVLMTDLALEPELGGTVSLYDIDAEGAEENAAFGNGISAREDAAGKWRYSAAGSLAEALDGADFVVISILPGTFKEMAVDVHAPEKYGVYQSVGDTVGLGGVLRGMRVIPMYEAFASGIRRYCPEAWVINYTNPMTMCVRTLYAVFPEVKAIGCCHEVFDTKTDLAGMLKTFHGIHDVRMHDITANILGINHFTWMDRVSYKTMDLMPVFARAAEECYEAGYEREENKHWRNSVFRNANRVKFDLFRRYGLIACAGDRHLAEFAPPAWYLNDPQTAEGWGFALTPVSWRVEDRKQAEALRRDYIEGKQVMHLAPSGEEGVLQMKALLGLEDYVTNVNLPNRGQMEGLPIHAVVETNALLCRDQALPIHAGRLPETVNALVMRHVSNQEALVSAALARDLRAAFNVFLNDPQCRLSLDDAKKLFEEMVRGTKDYLKGWR